MNRQERFLQWIVRIMGMASGTAVVFVAAPYSWMNAIHQWLGLGILPPVPVVGYLARSTSAFYALMGGLFLFISFDLSRHLPVLRFMGTAVILLGLTLFVVDWAEGLPPFWRWWEGPFDVAFGIVILWVSSLVQKAAGKPGSAE